MSAHPQQSPDMNKASPHLGWLVTSAATEQIVLGDGQSSAIQPITIQKEFSDEKKTSFNALLLHFIALREHSSHQRANCEYKCSRYTYVHKKPQ